MQSKLLRSLQAVWRVFASTTQAFVLPDGFVAMRTPSDTSDTGPGNAAAPAGGGLKLPDGTDRTERRQCRPLPA
jgi:hypothetical protein